MNFPRDICRLLGLGGEVVDLLLQNSRTSSEYNLLQMTSSNCPRDEEMEVENGNPDLTNRRNDQCSSQVMLTSEEGLDDDEKAKRKAERRRAKRKRQKERKKLEKEEKIDDASQHEEVAGAVSESDSEDVLKEEAQWTAVYPRNKCSVQSAPALVTTGNMNNCQLPHETSDEEPEWDVRSAFVANAASHIKLKGCKNRAVQISRENKENEVGNTKEMRRRGESLTVQGIQMFKQGQYSRAVDLFTKAIHCDPKDHRFYGNRSYCYSCLEQYSTALTDAQKSIQLAPDWPKGYFRKGCALMGLKLYGDAEKAIEQVLKLDQHCKEASSKLFTCRILQLMEMGFQEEQSKELLEKFTTVQAVITSPEVKALKHMCLKNQTGRCCSLWVGNITFEVAEKDLWELFKTFGEIESIRVLHERFCAFVNFKNANMAAAALEKLQGVELDGSKLVVRYPDRWIQRTLPFIQGTNSGLGSSAEGTQLNSAATGSKLRSSINGDECFYWRTTGCLYGDRCHFKHISDHQGQDKKP
ncbi:stress-induced-phosphoprotein 1-like isoform X2 [Anabas testudineus]|uniref:stress-induced-phosphoprotein 1-like isoform X2 n=1 Tax=Anabas testudineus TaxID=64144 RepID=UPI000E4569C8|nr:stress-induced-phosphoprotein 1-like isoform X2 [Anabas testudineus]